MKRAWSRSTPRPPASTPCRPACAASRSPWRRTKPATCRSPTKKTAAATGCSTPASRPTRSRKHDALHALKPLLEDKSILKVGAEHEIRLAGVRPARHRDRRLRRHHADFLRARRRQRRPRHGRSLRDDGWVTRPFISPTSPAPGKIAGQLRLRRHRQGDRIRRRGRRRDAAAVERAQTAPGRRARRHRLRDAGARDAGQCWRAWSGAAFPSTARCSRACPANSPRSRVRWRKRSRRSPASRSIPARPSNSATSCSAR